MCKPSPMKIINFDKVNSTMDTAVKLIQEGIDEPFIVTAEQQTMGRGRKNNKWYSPLGGLYITFAFPNLDLRFKNNIAMYHYSTALAVCSTLKDQFKVVASVKWPNDILIDNKKIGGILIEYISNGLNHLLIGIGLNINSSSKFFPEELKKNSISLRVILGKDVEFCEITKSLEANVCCLNSLVQQEEYDKIIQPYNELCSYFSKMIRLENGNIYRCKGINASGKLVLENDFEIKQLEINDTNAIISVL